MSAPAGPLAPGRNKAAVAIDVSVEKGEDQSGGTPKTGSPTDHAGDQTLEPLHGGGTEGKTSHHNSLTLLKEGGVVFKHT